MAQNVTVAGADYPDVPAVELPKTGGGTAVFTDISDTTADASDVADGEVFYDSGGTRSIGTGKYAASPVANGNAKKTNAILYGTVDGTSTSTAFTATVDGLTEYVDGTTIMLKNGVVTSAAGFTINVNGIGAKPVYNNMAAATAETTIFNVNYTMIFVYDSTRIAGGAWICYRGYVPTITSTDVTNALGYTPYNSTNPSGYITGMTILSYGNSTWQNFLDAYNSNTVVYCRASSNSNPAQGAQTRLAFMAYINANPPTSEVEFQYYRSVSSHSDTQQGDQVFVYKLNKTNGWSVIVREAYSKMNPTTGLTKSYSSGTLTISVTNPLPSVSSADNGKFLVVDNGSWTAQTIPNANGNSF